jgi:hypothetical protein
MRSCFSPRVAGALLMLGAFFMVSAVAMPTAEAGCGGGGYHGGGYYGGGGHHYYGAPRVYAPPVQPVIIQPAPVAYVQPAWGGGPGWQGNGWGPRRGGCGRGNGYRRNWNNGPRIILDF